MNFTGNVRYLIILFAFLHLACGNKEVKEKTESLKNTAIKINSIDPKDEDYSDLQFLKKIIERDSVQVILLGEQTHGDGSTFLAKSRLIKFLHKEAGFDVLAFESGLYDCTRAWEEAKVNGKYIEEIRKAVFPMWVNTNECEELVKYLQSTLSTSKPLELSGFDSKFTGFQYCLLFIDEIYKYSLQFLTQKEKNVFVNIVCMDTNVTSGMDKNYHNEVLDKMITGLDSLSKTDSRFEYYKLIVEGIKITINNFIVSETSNNIDQLINNGRDSQMAKNLLWLLKNKYKNRKIIVWAASFHNFRRSGELVSTDEKFKFINEVNKKKLTMGDILYDSLGKKIYSVGFTQYTGKRRNIQNNQIEDIPEHKDISLENIIYRTGSNYSFVDLRDNNNPSWLKDSFIANMPSKMEFKGKWMNVTDGIFFIKEMTPSTSGNEN
jgi:erythromycin esterase